MQKGQGKTLEGRVALKDAAIRHFAEDMPSPEQMTQVDAARHAHLEASSADLQTIALLNEDLRRANAELEASRAKLQASEDRLRTILESATEYAIITTDPQGQISGWSVGAQNIFGWTDEEVIGRDLTILFTPEDREHRAWERMVSIARHEGRADDERWHLRKNGNRFWVRGEVMPLGDGVLQGLLLILRDRTDERAATEGVQLANRRATDILDCITDAFVALDRDYRVTHQNRQAERIKGVPTYAVLGKTAWEAWPTSVGTPIEAAVRRAMDDRVSVQLEHRYQDDRVDAWLEFHIHPTPEGLGVFYRDITARKRAEDELRASHERTVEILESISDAFYAVDHDWRFTYINRQAERLAGRRREDLLGKVFWEVFRFRQISRQTRVERVEPPC